MQIDTSSSFGRRVVERLQSEQIVWLTTVSADGTPQPSPVWFVWDGQQVLMYSMPRAPKLRHIRANAKVALHFNSDAEGGDVVILTGEARIAENEPPAHKVPAYAQKYARDITDIGMNPESFAQAYSVPVRIIPSRVRGHD